MKIKDYAVIDINWLDKQMDIFKEHINNEPVFNAIYCTYKKVKEQLQPLLPICEKCFDAGKNQKKRAINAHPENFSLKKDKQDFLNSEIQLP